MSDWHEDVYGRGAEADFYKSLVDDPLYNEWDSIRRKVIRRDHQKCRRCDVSGKYGELTVHHIKPRDKGGTNHLSNLLTLCEKCHDFVECNINKLNTVAAIEGSKPLDGIDMEPLDAVLQEFRPRPKWHSMVYGGQKP